MAGDAEATRRRLVDAARTEFSEFGIAGARVDRIAAASGSNKAQIYHYFGSKDRLFDAVFETIVSGVVTETPIDVHDLPGYAVSLARGYEQHPDIMRLATWQRLERSDDAPLPIAVESVRHKVDEIGRAQAAGIVADHFPAAVLLTLILQTAAMWSAVNPELAVTLAETLTTEERFDVVAEAVRRFLEP